MAAKSILPSGNTTFLPELENGTADLSVSSLLIGTGVGNITLSSVDSGVLLLSGAIQATDIVDNADSIGTPGQVLVKADAGTDMLWSSDISVPSTITAGTGFTATTGGITITAGNVDCQAGELQAGSAQIGYGSAAGTVVLQVGDPSGTNADFSISAAAGNPLAISRAITASGTITASAGDIVASAGDITAAAGTISAADLTATATITAGTGFTATTGGFTATAGNVDCQAGELQAGSAQIGYGSAAGTVVLQVGNPAGTNADFSISAAAGNPLAISRAITASGTITASAGDIVATAGNITADAGTISAADLTASATITAGTGFTATTGGFTATAGNVDCQAGELQAGSAQIGYGSAAGTVVLQVGNPAGTNADFSIGAGAGNPLVISRIIQPAGLVDANGLTGTAGQYPVANGAGGFVWTTV